jgi:prepilin-type N-terminal cleavage/methylation domain-containing protein
MKLTNTHSMKAKSGMTLLELTVVILVLLSLISILFVGARAWKKGSDRSANIMNIRNTQQAMRGHQNMNDVKDADITGSTPRAAFTQATLETYMKFPKDVNTTVSYQPGTQITPASAAPPTSYAHIWIVPSAAALPTADYGQAEYADSEGW